MSFLQYFLTVIGIFGTLIFIYNLNDSGWFDKIKKPKLRIVYNGHYYVVQSKRWFKWVNLYSYKNTGYYINDKQDSIDCYNYYKEKYEVEYAKFKRIIPPQETPLGKAMEKDDE